jgi:hypothetical protein
LNISHIVFPVCVQLEAWDQRTGVITTAKETTAAIQQRVIGAMAKAAENERVHSVVTNVSTGVSSSWCVSGLGVLFQCALCVLTWDVGWLNTT